MKSTGWRLLTVRTVQNWWEPTALGFLNHVSKAQIVDALKEAGAEVAADEIGVLKAVAAGKVVQISRPGSAHE